MAFISVRVSNEIKERIDRLKYINWSEVIRRAIIKTLEEEEGRNLAKAVLLNEKIRKKAPEQCDSTGIIRYRRQHRYRANSKERIVSDASVIVKWFIQEKHSDNAFKVKRNACKRRNPHSCSRTTTV